MLDATRTELEQDLLGGDPDLSSAALHGALAARARDGSGGEPWSLLISDLRFGPAVRDARLLGALGTLARGVGAPFVAGALPALIGCAHARQLADPAHWIEPAGEEAEAWTALRRSPAARWLALALPRLLLRLPYGPRSDAIDSFPFEEAPDPADDDAFLWGGPALAPAQMLARAYAASGWALGPDAVRDLDELPAYVRDTPDGRALLPCAEALLPEHAVQALIRHGLVPLISQRDAPRVRVAALPSLAADAAPLAGPWASEVP
jgi:type VI secretion system protein ImpC